MPELLTNIRFIIFNSAKLLKVLMEQAKRYWKLVWNMVFVNFLFLAVSVKARKT